MKGTIIWGSQTQIFVYGNSVFKRLLISMISLFGRGIKWCLVLVFNEYVPQASFDSSPLFNMWFKDRLTKALLPLFERFLSRIQERRSFLEKILLGCEFAKCLMVSFVVIIVFLCGYAVLLWGKYI